MAALKISDLSVGDWVEFKGELCKVLECGAIIVSPGMIEFKPRLVLSAKYDIYDCVEVDKVRPIPITAEILEKNRWSTDGMYAILRIDEHLHLEYYYHEHRLRKYYCGVDEWQNHAKVTDITFAVHCYSVHQLQHALRLAGVDKEINL